MKRCKICAESKTLDSFSKNKQQKDGFNIYCKVCMSERYSNPWYKNNKDRHGAGEKRRREQDPDKKRQQNAEWYRKNKEVVLGRQLEYQRKKYQTDPCYAIKTTLAATIRSAISYKGLSFTDQKPRTHELVGCSYPELKIYLESKFEPWMSWDNRGRYNGTLQHGWDIDHIIPLSSASSIEELEKLCHYTNMQPLCSYQNRNVKRNKLPNSN